jgi:hypothetical protein
MAWMSLVSSRIWIEPATTGSSPALVSGCGGGLDGLEDELVATSRA